MSSISFLEPLEHRFLVPESVVHQGDHTLQVVDPVSFFQLVHKSQCAIFSDHTIVSVSRPLICVISSCEGKD